MLLKKIVTLIILLCPITLVAQSLTKSNTTKLNKPAVVKKYTYDDDEIRIAKLTKPFTDKIYSVNELIRKKSDTLNRLISLLGKNKVQQDIDSLFKITDYLESQITTVRFNFIRNNPSSFLSLEGLSLLLKRSAELPILCDTIKSLFNNLNKSIQNSISGRKFKLLLVNQEKSKVGSLAPDFKVKDIDNKEISLSSFQNQKYVLLDFWASWCEPCRDDMPLLKDIYKSYNEKGLEIIDISKDDNLSSWEKAIQKDSTQIWRHISVPLHIQPIDSSAITNRYFVYGIPVKILINKEGVIIGRWQGGGKENISELENLLKDFL